MHRPRLLAALVALGIAWGTTIPLTKIAVSTGHRPLGLIFWQLAIGACVLATVAWLRRAPPARHRRALGFYAVIALIGTIVPNTFSYLAVSRLPAGVMAIVIASVPMFALAVALALRLERASIRRGAGVGLGALAVALLLGPDASLPEPGQAPFVLVALVAPLCYGAEASYIALRAPADVDPVSTLLGASIGGAALAWPLAVLTGSWVDMAVPWGRAEWALLGASLCHVTAYTGYVWLVGAAGAVFASQVSYVVTVSAVGLSVLLLAESYAGWVWGALAAMIAGLALVKPRPARAATPPGAAR